MCSYAKVPKFKPGLISLNSKEGQLIFEQTTYKNSFWQLIPYFITQKNLSFCGPASIAMTLNALKLDPPALTEENLNNYKMFDQDNIFNIKVNKIIKKNKIKKSGMTLNEMFEVLNTFNLKNKIYYGSDINEKQFIEIIIQAILKNKIVIINYCRKYIRNTTSCGHFSPVGAYNAHKKMFLILDVSRYKYQPTWIPQQKLFTAISKGVDSESKKSRGFIISYKE
ncbi:phytochelatin synthase [Paraphotobacterium marinum]|uniref:glutathione gamma-glutamylcysteinyltransferase n=1 Tax=Paraphotobacterium marinum TaxID=1755811 RepID=A0A220VER4_9GAMM|nr:phytochelatin synthase family protein [Paraphotobacterium marinum]ASK78672.1 phytochelatin synthase [Paraphotobacterium marinum]